MPTRPLKPKLPHIWHPLPFQNFSFFKSTFSPDFSDIAPKSSLTRSIVSDASLSSILHSWQIFLTSRWPITAFNAGANRKGLTPMDRNRDTAPEAENAVIGQRLVRK